MSDMSTIVIWLAVLASVLGVSVVLILCMMLVLLNRRATIQESTHSSTDPERQPQGSTSTENKNINQTASYYWNKKRLASARGLVHDMTSVPNLETRPPELAEIDKDPDSNTGLTGLLRSWGLGFGSKEVLGPRTEYEFESTHYAGSILSDNDTSAAWPAVEEFLSAGVKINTSKKEHARFESNGTTHALFSLSSEEHKWIQEMETDDESYKKSQDDLNVGGFEKDYELKLGRKRSSTC